MRASRWKAVAVTTRKIGANDNIETPRVRVRETFAIEELVATRRRLKVKDRSVTEGAVGRILNVRAPGRLYDVGFPSAVVMTLSHCDIARYQGRRH